MTTVKICKMKDVMYKVIQEYSYPVEDIKEIDIEHLYGTSKLRGAYILMFRNGQPYIGSTMDIHKRLLHHRQKFKNVSCVIFLRTKDIKDAILLEDYLIRRVSCRNVVSAIKMSRYMYYVSEGRVNMILLENAIKELRLNM